MSFCIMTTSNRWGTNKCVCKTNEKIIACYAISHPRLTPPLCSYVFLFLKSCDHVVSRGCQFGPMSTQLLYLSTLIALQVCGGSIHFLQTRSQFVKPSWKTRGFFLLIPARYYKKKFNLVPPFMVFNVMNKD